MIVLVGFMGAGKTTVGRTLAAMLGLPFIDTDERIEQGAGRTIREIFASEGEPAFRALERAAIAAAVSGPEAVVALGGGALGDPRTRTDLEWHDVVHLDVSYGEALRRIGTDGTRPMLATGDTKALYDERQRYYSRSARATVTTHRKRPDQVAAEVASALGRTVEGEVRRVVVDVAESYEIVVGAGTAAQIDEMLPALPGAEAAFILTHPSVRHIASLVESSLARAGLAVHLLEVPEGERAKSLDEARRLYDALAAAPARRRDLIVGVGGGVVTDLAGFIASTYNRGMPVVHVATTLLAQVDAAVGGKTGVNLPAGKNLVGTIHQPRLVVCDPETLTTLPEDEFVSGLAEVAKYGFIQDPDLLDVLLDGAEALRARDPRLLRDVITRSVAIKAAIVSVDERESGVRELLNYGHTFGHAIEHSAGFSIRHGHGVALGMMAAAYLSFELSRIESDVVDRHKEVLEALGLPVHAELDIDVLERAWIRDKKYRGGVRFVLLAGLGRAEAGIKAPRAAIERALERMR